MDSMGTLILLKIEIFQCSCNSTNSHGISPRLVIRPWFLFFLNKRFVPASQRPYRIHFRMSNKSNFMKILLRNIGKHGQDFFQDVILKTKDFSGVATKLEGFSN